MYSDFVYFLIKIGQKNTLWDLATFNTFLKIVKGDTPILQNRAKKNNDFLSSLGLHILWVILNVHPSIWNGHVRTAFDRDTFSSIGLITNLLRTKMQNNILILEGFVYALLSENMTSLFNYYIVHVDTFQKIWTELLKVG